MRTHLHLLALVAGAVALACHPRTEMRFMSDCGVPSDSALVEPPPSITPMAGRPGEIHVEVRNWRGTLLSHAVVFAIGPTASSGIQAESSRADSAFVLRAPREGRYQVLVRALAHRRRSVDVALSSDAGAKVVLSLADDYSQLNCDGFEMVRRPWWRFW